MAKNSRLIDLLENETIKEITSTKTRDIFSGQIFFKNYISQFSLVTLFAVFLTIIYMNNRMVCEKSLTRIDELNKILTNEKYISMITEAELLDNSRIDKIEDLLIEKELELVENNKIPYTIKMDK